jgi:MFS family permease
MPASKELSASPKSRFSLAALLLAPLILSPLFLAGRDSLRVVTRHRHVDGIETYGLVFAYAFALTFISYRRRKAASAFTTKKPFLWFLTRGVIFGVLFFALFAIPVGITEQIVVYSSPRPWTDRLRFFALGFAGIVLLGTVFGGAAGGILGLFLSRRPAKPDHAPISQNSEN